jgi:hypothetical protein
MQAQLQGEKMKTQFETESKVLVSNQDYQEETALQAQRGQNDIALAIVEGDLRNEQQKRSNRAA